MANADSETIQFIYEYLQMIQGLKKKNNYAKKICNRSKN